VEEFITALVLGVLSGGVYGLFSVGLSLSFGVMRIVNFAHGDFVMIGMYIAVVFTQHTSLSVYWSLPISLLISIPLGYFVYIAVFKPFRKASPLGHDQLVVALGLSLVIEAAAQNAFGTNTYVLHPVNVPSVHLGFLDMAIPQLIAFGVAIAAFLILQYVLTRTPVGRKVRAVVQDRQMAVMIGINDRRIYVWTFVVSIALALAAGVVLYGYLPATTDVGSSLILVAFVAVILGGVGDLPGTFAAGIIIGVIESLTSAYWNAAVQDVVVYIAFLGILLVRPKGIFGRGLA
jgi:branched-chain amino acid transport system permease protein